MASSHVSLPVANLISGVSQQPAALRLATSAQAMLNGWPSVVTGLNKRPPTEHLASLGIIDAEDAVGYLIDRDSSYEYIVVIAKGDLKVYNLKGEQQTVNFPGGKAYITSTAKPSDDFRFMTFGDTTFILNRSVTVQGNAFGETGAVGYPYDGEVYTFQDLPVDAVEGQIYHISATDQYYKGVKNPAASATIGWTVTSGLVNTPYTSDPVVTALPAYAATGYKVWLKYQNGTSTQYALYEVTTVAPSSPESIKWQLVRLSDLIKDLNNSRLNPSGRYTIFVKEAVANINYSVYVNGNRIATYLTPNGTDANNAVPATDVIAYTLCNRINANTGYTASNLGSTITMKGVPDTATLVVTSSSGDRVMSCYYDTVDSFSDLPPNEFYGRIIKVKGDAKNQQDDYYVRYNRTGLWQETFGYNEGGSLVNQTMPHALRRNVDGSWTFGAMSWTGRRAGDSTSNQDPSFVGQTINDIFLWQSRLGLLAGENVCLSCTGELQSFYRTTMQTLIDSDPVDLAVFSPNVDNLRHAVPFDKDVLLFSDRSQYRMLFQNYVSPKTVTTHFTTSFPCTPVIKPVNMASSVYFVDDRAGYNYAKVFEYFPRPDNGDDAVNVTDPVPQYVKTGCRFLTASTRVQAMLVGSAGDYTSAYLYKFYWSGDKKVQNAWSKWTFPGSDRLYWAGFSLDSLYMIVKRGQELFLEKMRVNEEGFNLEQGKSRIMLDRRITKDKLVFAYDDARRITTVTLPYQTTSEIQLVYSGGEKDRIWPTCKQISSNTVEVQGDIRGYDTIYAGLTYTFSYTFSTPYVRIARTTGGEVVAQDGRLQMRYLQVEYHDTSAFRVRLDVPGRDPIYRTFDVKTADKPGSDFDTTKADSGFARVPVMAQNINCSVTIINDSPFSSSFGSAEWTALYTPKTKRI